LCWALDKVLGKALGRQVSGDSEEAPQRRSPTTSTCRQWAAAVVDHVDYAADEVHEEP